MASGNFDVITALAFFHASGFGVDICEARHGCSGHGRFALYVSFSSCLGCVQQSLRCTVFFSNDGEIVPQIKS